MSAFLILVTAVWYWVVCMCMLLKCFSPTDMCQHAGVRASSFSCQLFSLQPGRTLHTATRLRSIRHSAILAATSSNALQRKVSHILLKADQAELLDELEERIQGSYFCFLLQTSCCTTYIGHDPLAATQNAAPLCLHL